MQCLFILFMFLLLHINMHFTAIFPSIYGHMKQQRIRMNCKTVNRITFDVHTFCVYIIRRSIDITSEINLTRLIIIRIRRKLDLDIRIVIDPLFRYSGR